MLGKEDQAQQSIGKSPREGNVAGFDTSSRKEFYEYYARQSEDTRTLERFTSIRDTLLRALDADRTGSVLEVIDVGCGAGSQGRLWTAAGHRYLGIDIYEPLITLARQRAAAQGTRARFDIGTASALPCDDSSFDVCTIPELLEHIVDWKACLDEAARVLRPGGLLYVSTTNRLCPIQNEFNLPAYSLYPQRLKRYFERRAATDWPALANYATYPAVHWFTFRELQSFLASKGFISLDRFDLLDTRGRSRLNGALIAATKRIPLLRWLGHAMTPYTVVVGKKIHRDARR